MVPNEVCVLKERCSEVWLLWTGTFWKQKINYSSYTIPFKYHYSLIFINWRSNILALRQFKFRIPKNILTLVPIFAKNFKNKLTHTSNISNLILKLWKSENLFLFWYNGNWLHDSKLKFHVWLRANLVCYYYYLYCEEILNISYDTYAFQVYKYNKW